MSSKSQRKWTARLSVFPGVLPVALLAAALAGQTEVKLSSREAAIARHVEAQAGEGLKLLEEAVNLNSGTMNLAGVRRVGDLFRQEFEKLGLETRWVNGESFGRAGHLLAERNGQGPRILLIGHLDTVFEPDSPFQHYRQLTADEARGPGITDMKGGNVIIVQALRALRSAGLLESMSLTVIMTGDEEKPGAPRELARQALIEAAEEADVALGFEDGDGDPGTAVIARRGSASWTLRVSGTPAHSSQIFQPQFGAGAIFEAARVLNGFRERLSGQNLLTFNPGVILGGTTVNLDASQARGTAFGKENVIAEHAVVTGDLRCISPEQLAGTRATMQSIATESLPGTSSNLVFSNDSYPPMAPSDGNRRLLSLYDRVSRDLGLGPVTAVDPRNAGAADISFAASRVTMALDGLGLMGRDGHTVEETADLSTLETQTKRAAVLLFRLTSAER